MTGRVSVGSIQPRAPLTGQRDPPLTALRPWEEAIGRNEHPREHAITMRALNYSVDFGKLAFLRLKIRFKYRRKKDYDSFAFLNTN